jgi:hypothetical protein
MTIDKAIEILQAIRHTGHYQPTIDDVHAVELGIEALFVVKANRNPDLPVYIGLLPGEDSE